LKTIRKLLKVIGPGFITGAADDDPSGIGTYSQTGAQFGYSQSWLALFSFPFMTVIQEMCGRIGMVTGKGLSGVISRHYTKSLLYVAVFILVIANTVNIGADLGAMASSAQLFLHIPFAILLLSMTGLTLILEIFISYQKYAKYLKYLTLSLFAYVVTVFIVKQDWSAIAKSTFIPSVSLNKEYIMNVVAIFGTTISPYLFFWQADEEVEEAIAKNKMKASGEAKPAIKKGEIKSMRIDTILGMFFSNLVMFFIILTTASTLHAHNITNIETADQAALALRPLAGDFAFILFALGIVGTGFLALPVLAGSASYAVSEAFKWKSGLSLKFRDAKAFYAIIIVSTIIGLLVNFTSIKPFQMLYYTAMLNGICAPPLMVLILVISNNKKIMGKHTNSLFSNILGIIITIIMTIAAVLFFVL
jgi:NRAMP (natural resistance-associated macrophage protein)-like metal ion transporter